jgi:hypothetical protein
METIRDVGLKGGGIEVGQKVDIESFTSTGFHPRLGRIFDCTTLPCSSGRAGVKGQFQAHFGQQVSMGRQSLGVSGSFLYFQKSHNI